MAEMRMHVVTLIPGDGIGPEVTEAVVRVLETAGARTGVGFEWHRFDAGAGTFRRRCMSRSNRTRWR